MKIINNGRKYTVYDDDGKIIIITTNKFCINNAISYYRKIKKYDLKGTVN